VASFTSLFERVGKGAGQVRERGESRCAGYAW
jgi:hypothetical protein